MFHHFHGTGHPVVQGSIDAGQLTRMVEFLSGQHRILDAREWLAKALAGRLDKSDLCLTFDDSLLCQKDVAIPVLRKLGITAFFFIYSSVFQGNLEPLEIYRAFRTKYFDSVDTFYGQFFEKVETSEYATAYMRAMKAFSPTDYLSEHPFYSDDDRKFRFVRDQVLNPDAYNLLMNSMIADVTSIHELSQFLWMKDRDLEELALEGHVIGLHSYSHSTRLAELPPAEQEREYSLNVEHLKSVLGAPPQVMSHPCNSYGDLTLDILSRLGVRVGFQATMARPGETKLEYPREDHANILRMMEGGGH